MKKISIGNNGNNYPMYQLFKKNDDNEIQLDLISEEDKLVEVGDTIEKANSTYKVIDVRETRPAKGNHPKPVTFQRLIVE